MLTCIYKSTTIPLVKERKPSKQEQEITPFEAAFKFRLVALQMAQRSSEVTKAKIPYQEGHKLVFADNIDMKIHDLIRDYYPGTKTQRTILYRGFENYGLITDPPLSHMPYRDRNSYSKWPKNLLIDEAHKHEGIFNKEYAKKYETKELDIKIVLSNMKILEDAEDPEDLFLILEQLKEYKEVFGEEFKSKMFEEEFNLQNFLKLGNDYLDKYPFDYERNPGKLAIEGAKWMDKHKRKDDIGRHLIPKMRFYGNHFTEILEMAEEMHIVIGGEENKLEMLNETFFNRYDALSLGREKFGRGAKILVHKVERYEHKPEQLSRYAQ
jgi:hypothetical protein